MQSMRVSLRRRSPDDSGSNRFDRMSFVKLRTEVRSGPVRIETLVIYRVSLDSKPSFTFNCYLRPCSRSLVPAGQFVLHVIR